MTVSECIERLMEFRGNQEVFAVPASFNGDEKFYDFMVTDASDPRDLDGPSIVQIEMDRTCQFASEG